MNNLDVCSTFLKIYFGVLYDLFRPGWEILKFTKVPLKPSCGTGGTDRAQISCGTSP